MEERTMTLSDGIDEILITAEDVIQKKLKHYQEMAREMTDKDIYNFQLLVITAGRIRAIRRGQEYYQGQNL